VTAARPSRDPGLASVATYNIHKCVGLDGRHDPDRTARVLRELDADIVGLQEVDARYHDEEGDDQAEYLAGATGMTAVSGPALVHHHGTYGNAVLTRWPVKDVRRVEIGVVGREPRAVLDTDIDVGGFEVRVIVTHFGLRTAERRVQTEMLVRMLGPRRDGCTILLGDFNEWVPIGHTLRRLHAELGRSRGVRSFPSRLPVLALDRIWVRPARALVALQAHRSRIASAASDHLPVVGTVRLGT
jgi:endonuclease/exonuclease/phosphatase family metal-dependent hydrolase